MVIAFDFDERVKLEEQIKKILRKYDLKGYDLCSCASNIIDVMKTVLDLEELEQ